MKADLFIYKNIKDDKTYYYTWLIETRSFKITGKNSFSKQRFCITTAKKKAKILNINLNHMFQLSERRI